MLKRKKKISIIISILTISVIFLYSSYVLADEEDEEEINEQVVQENILESAAKINEEPTLNARSAIIFDRTTQKTIWGKNENERKAMASTTKIMTCIIVLENSNLEDIVTISKKAAGTGGSRLKINTGDKISVKDLLYGLMLRSRK